MVKIIITKYSQKYLIGPGWSKFYKIRHKMIDRSGVVKIITKYSQILIGPGWSKFYKIRQVRGGQNYHKIFIKFDRSGAVKILQN